MIDQAIILAGGKGSRLGDLTKEVPKVLLPIADHPFLEYLIWNLKRHGITRIILTVGYLAKAVKDVLGDGSRLGVQLGYNTESAPLGTGGALSGMKDLLDDNFFVLNGDTIFDVNFSAMAEIHKKNGALATIALREIEDRERFGSVRVEDCWITSFEEKNKNNTSGLISGGIYLFSKNILDSLPEGAASLENDLFPSLITSETKKLAGMPSNGFFIDIGLPGTYEAAQYLIPEWWSRPVHQHLSQQA